MKQTPNINLPILEQGDKYLKETQNEAFSVIDREIAGLNSAISVLDNVEGNIVETKSDVETLKNETNTLKASLNDMASNVIPNIQTSLDNIENEIDVKSVKVHFPQRALNKSDCIVIETKQNVTIIDVGWETDSTNLINYLKGKGITKIDNIIITHYHDDHIGGITGQGFNSLINSSLDFTECTCFLPHKDIDYTKFVDNVGNGIAERIRTAHNSILNYLNNKGITTKYADEGEILQLNILTNLKLMNISSSYLNEYYNQTLNNNDIEQGYTCYNNFSLVAELTHVNNKFLFSGDIELKAQEILLNMLSNNYDVYKVEHHGVNKSTFKDYLYKINPRIAIVQNRSTLGLRNKMTTTYLYNKGCKIYDNTSCGDIVVKSNGVDVYVDSITESKIDIGFNYCGQPYDLKRGIAIKENEDLNEFTDLGVYYSETSAITTSLHNKPNNVSGGFKLIVQARQTDTSPIQMLIDSNGYIYTRTYSSSVFGKWVELSDRHKGYINCGLSAQHTTTSTNTEKLNIGTISISKGNLSLENGSVKIGAGITAIKVSGQIGWSSNANGTNVLEGYIYKNESSVIRNGITSINTYFGVPLSPKIIDVQEGDIISLYARSRTKEGFTISHTKDSTWLNVEVV